MEKVSKAGLPAAVGVLAAPVQAGNASAAKQPTGKLDSGSPDRANAGASGDSPRKLPQADATGGVRSQGSLQALGDDPTAQGKEARPLGGIPAPEGNWASLPAFKFHPPAMFGMMGAADSDPVPNPRASWLAGQSTPSVCLAPLQKPETAF